MQKTLPKGKREMYDINDGLLNRKKNSVISLSRQSEED